MLLPRIICEFVGTLVFFTVILQIPKISSIPQLAIVIVPLGLFAALLFHGSGHYNPGVSMMLAIRKDIDIPTCVGLIIAQLVAMVLAVFMVSSQ